jgi:ATP-dependent DNA ligase
MRCWYDRLVPAPSTPPLRARLRTAATLRPMPLLRLAQPFDHPDWLFEVKHDGFRALAHIDGHHCHLVSRNGHTFKHWPQLCELAHATKAHNAVIDGEIVCLDRRGRSNFKNLLFRRDWPFFYAFDLLAVDGEDRREWPVIERKRRLRQLIPSVQTRLLYVDHITARGRDFFEVARAHDLEGIVAKPATGRYLSDGASTNWIKIKNTGYTQLTARHELFDSRSGTKAYAQEGAAADSVREVERAAGLTRSVAYLFRSLRA